MAVLIDDRVVGGRPSRPAQPVTVSRTSKLILAALAAR